MLAWKREQLSKPVPSRRHLQDAIIQSVSTHRRAKSQCPATGQTNVSLSCIIVCWWLPRLWFIRIHGMLWIQNQHCWVCWSQQDCHSLWLLSLWERPKSRAFGLNSIAFSASLVLHNSLSLLDVKMNARYGILRSWGEKVGRMPDRPDHPPVPKWRVIDYQVQ